jgi:hypothetical protein
MMLLKRPVGVWILMVWCAVQALAGLVIGLDSSGMRGVLAWGFVIVQALFVAGLALPVSPTRHFVAAYLAVKIFAVAVAVWAIVFVATAWGLRNTACPWSRPSWGTRYSSHGRSSTCSIRTYRPTSEAM